MEEHDIQQVNEVADKKEPSKKDTAIGCLTLIILLVIITLIIKSCGGCSDEDSSDNSKAGKPASGSEYSLNFEPVINPVVETGKITVNADVDCPDGAIMQVMLMSGDLSEMYSDKPIVKGRKISSVFTLKNTDVKNYGGSFTFQFNADSLQQPDNVKTVFGEKGEKLEGDNTQESNFKDNTKGKNASVTFTVPYPSKDAVDKKITAIFNEMANEMVANSDGLILTIEHPEPGIFEMQVSNNWYLSNNNVKQYFAEQMLKTFTQVGKNMDGEDYTLLTIYDESMNTVASSKILGGMEIKR